MLEEAELLQALRRHWDYTGKDEDAAHEIYHDDAVLEFPQSGERFEGVENWRIISPCGSYGLVRSWCWCEPRWARRCCCSYFHQFQRSCAVRSVAFVQKWPFFFTAWLGG